MKWFSFLSPTHPSDTNGIPPVHNETNPASPSQTPAESVIIQKLNHQLQQANEKIAQMLQKEKEQFQSSEDNKRALVNLLEDARELEDQLKTERDRAQAIVSSIGDGLIAVDKQLRIVLMNPIAESLLEIKFTDVQGKPWDEFISVFKDNELVPPDQRPLATMLREGKITTYTITDNYYYQTKSGRKFPIALSNAPLLGTDGVVGGVSVFRDITHEKEEKNVIERTVKERTQELRDKNEALVKAQYEVSQGWLQAQREKARLTSSINSLPIGFILTDKDGTIFMMNPTAKTTLNLTGDTLKVDMMQAHLGSACNISDLLTQSRSANSIVSQHDILINSMYINITLVPILLDVGKEFLGTAILIENITERKITDRARDEFFSIASHELRTPLTAIRGNTALIKQYFADMLQGNKELMEMIEDIHSSSVRLIQIVNDFLNASRLEMKKMTYKYSDFDLKQVVEKVHKELETNVQEKHDQLQLTVHAEPIPIAYADADRVKEVLFNLIGNAIKYTDNGNVTTDISIKDNQLYIAITDSGLGIPPERWDLLFRKFQQAGENLYTRDTNRSTGLGLYISKLMVEEMGGKIGLERSEVNKGSTFFFTVPIAK